ncbi:MAG: hypothetical protein LHW56_05155, partial [Candidatus Cloacimonetes bacterium]|nr:hypothetical protein [Candidatus Cloacimonadota bacterium]MDY0172279.1 hypothetical protein [Candidatus Cloacimonadaceae bacterium]
TTSASHYCKIISNIPLVSNKANSPDRDSTSNPRLVFHVNSKTLSFQVNDTGTFTVLHDKLSKVARSILRNGLQEGSLAHFLDYSAKLLENNRNLLNSLCYPDQLNENLLDAKAKLSKHARQRKRTGKG